MVTEENVAEGNRELNQDFRHVHMWVCLQNDTVEVFYPRNIPPKKRVEIKIFHKKRRELLFIVSINGSSDKKEVRTMN